MNRSILVSATLVCGLFVATGAMAQIQPPPQNVLMLSASATVEVPKDWLSVTLSTTREGGDAAAVQGPLKQALETALGEARKAAKPGQIEVRTGAFSIFPRYAPKGGISGWQGNAELVIEGRDSVTIAQLAGRLQTMSIARVASSLSREAREKVEGDVAAQAIARFRGQAEAYARLFGLAGYTVREVNVGLAGEGPTPLPVMRAQMSAMAGDAALPVEAGKAAVSATVSGSVQMLK